MIDVTIVDGVVSFESDIVGFLSGVPTYAKEVEETSFHITIDGVTTLLNVTTSTYNGLTFANSTEAIDYIGRPIEEEIIP